VAESKPWKFTQLAGDRKVLTLAGESAPHGRPRASPVVEDEMALRDIAVYYPGNRRPTRHSFGEIHTDWTLTGRFADRFLGQGGARAKVLELKEFIADQQPVHIEWGDILAATGLVRRIKPSRESEAEIAWTLTVGIDGDDAMPAALPQPPASSPAAALGSLGAPLASFQALSDRPRDLPLDADFLSALDDLVSLVGTLTASVLGVAHDIDNVEKALAGDLNRLRANIQQLETAVLELHQTLDSAQNDFAVTSASGASEAAWHAARADASAEAFAMAALLADSDRQLEIAQRGRAQTTHVVAAGDTWESLSTRYYGGPSKADVLRKANGALYGEKPRAGRTVQIPSV
jgi:nucleoid-associated protein YgaU